ncbi:MAG: EsaB/YukD family protein [Tepidisphaeraceae bacterium]
MVTVQVWDATGNKRREVEMPDDAPVNRILAVLLEKMNFPRNGPDGQVLSYKFHHKASGKQLLDTQTLADVGVKPGDILRLQPEITAGAPFLPLPVLRERDSRLATALSQIRGLFYAP